MFFILFFLSLLQHREDKPLPLWGIQYSIDKQGVIVALFRHPVDRFLDLWKGFAIFYF